MRDDMNELGLHPEWVVFRDIKVERPHMGKNV